jgi:hypothetical protein
MSKTARLNKLPPTNPITVRANCQAIMAEFCESVRLAIPQHLKSTLSNVGRLVCDAKEAMRNVDAGGDFTKEMETAATHGVVVPESSIEAVAAFCFKHYGVVTILPNDSAFSRYYVVFVPGEHDQILQIVDALEARVP